MTNNIAFLTPHTPGAGRKGSLLHFADALSAKGNEVSIVRLGTSLIGDLLSGRNSQSERHNVTFPITTNQTGLLAHTIIHPFNTRNKVANSLLSPIYKLYPRMVSRGAWNILSKANTIICESGVGVLLVPAMAKLAQRPRLIYSASDRLTTLQAHPMVIAAERSALSYFSKIRVPALAMLDEFEGYPVQYIQQGLDVANFSQPRPSPYKGKRNAVSVGDMLFDPSAISTLASAYPEWTFHLLGRKAKLSSEMPNVIEHGEVPYERTIGFIQHADIGLAPYRNAPSADYLSQSSLKMTQYSYCKLPIVAPTFAAPGRSNVCAYEPQNAQSLIMAFQAAQITDRSTITGKFLTWDEAADLLLQPTTKADT